VRHPSANRKPQTDRPPTGTFTAGTDLTYSFAVTVPFNVTFDVPASCTGGTSCAALGVGASQTLTNGTLTCIGTGSCVCTLMISDVENKAGTYSTSGTILSIVNAADGSTSSGDYCVQANTLHLIDVDTMNMGPLGLATIIDDTTFTRQ
jgi:hypothetical protein